MENLKNLEKIAKIFQPQNIITSEEIDQVLKGIMEILASYKKGTDAINEDTKSVVNSLLEQTIKYNQETISDFKSEAEKAHAERMKELQGFLSEVKTTLGDMEAMMSEVKDGKDADEERVIGEVINRIKIDPTVVTMSAEEVRDKLASLKDDDRLDKSAIKGLEKVLQQKDLDYAIATLQHQASFLINKGGIKNVTAGTNVTIDYTDPSNPVISSTGGGSGSPGGSDTQLQYNNAGSLGGISGATTDGTAVTFANNGLKATNILASSSAGVLIEGNSGTDVALFGAGGGAGATFYGGLTLNTMTQGSVLFAGASGLISQDNSNLFWDDTNNVLGVGTASPLTQTGNRLQVGDNSASSQYLVFQTSNGHDRGIHYYLNDGTTLRGYMKWDLNEDLLLKGDVTFISTGSVSNAFTFMDGGGIGLMGIGTTSPTHSLTLNSTSTGISLYNTADQTTNYERVQMYWTGNVYTIQTQKGGSGSNRNLTIGTVSRVLQFLESPTGTQGFYTFSNSTGGSSNALSITTTRSNSASVAAELTIQPTYNQSSTAGYTCLLINPTETTTGSGSKLLADFQVGGSSKAKIDNNGLITTPSLIEGFTTTATAAGTTTLTVTSTYTQIFTGTTTQTVRLATTGVAQGQQYSITNNSTGNVTVQSSGANTIQILGAGMSAIFTALVATPTTAANWSCALEEFAMVNNAITATANAATINLAAKTNTVTNNSAAGLTVTIPTAGAIDGEMRVVRILPSTAAAQTLTLVNTENSAAVSAPANTGSSTTIPITIGLQYNNATTKWTVIASA